jgi:ribosomal protein L7/L12
MGNVDTSSPAACTVTLRAYPADCKVSVLRVIQGVTGLPAADARALVRSLPATFDLRGVPAAEDAERSGWSAVVAACELAGSLITMGATVEHVGAITPLQVPADVAARLLPDRETLEQRLRNAQSELYDVDSLIRTAYAALTNEGCNDVDSDDIATALRLAAQRLRELRAPRGLHRG